MNHKACVNQTVTTSAYSGLIYVDKFKSKIAQFVIHFTVIVHLKYITFMNVQYIKPSCDKSGDSEIKVGHFNLKSTLHVSGFFSINSACDHLT